MVGVGALGLVYPRIPHTCFHVQSALLHSQIIEAADFGFLHVSSAFVSRMEKATGVFVETTTTADCIIRRFRSAGGGFVVTHITIEDSIRTR